jgi:hypothetical protein
MARHELVDRIARRNQDSERQIAPSPCPAEPLPKPGHRPRISGADDRIERTNVDSELEGIRRDDTTDLSFSKRRFDAPARFRQVTASVCMNRRPESELPRAPSLASAAPPS